MDGAALRVRGNATPSRDPSATGIDPMAARTGIYQGETGAYWDRLNTLPADRSLASSLAHRSSVSAFSLFKCQSSSLGSQSCCASR